MKITVHECALLLCGSPGWVRSLVERGKIGDCFSNGKGRRKTYRIVPSQLADFLRISEEEVERRLEAVRNVGL